MNDLEYLQKLKKEIKEQEEEIKELKKGIEDNAILHKRLAKANETIRLLLQDADSGIDSPN